MSGMGTAKCSWCGLKTATKDGRFITHLAKGKDVSCPNTGQKATAAEIRRG